MMLPRRQFLKLAAGAAAWSGPSSALAQSSDTTPQPTQAERAAMSDLARAFMEKYAVPGLSFAVGHGGAIVHQDAFGFADQENKEAVTPRHLFRIASVTKTITSVTIFSLIEAGRINLTEKVFGPNAITGTDYGQPPYNPGVDQITIEHLLTHTSGGWSNTDNDPMFRNLSMNHAELIQWTLRNRPLDHPPGQNYAYSNFGYCVLGRVIEKITRQPYADYARAAVLKRCGVTDMAIAGNTLAQRQRGEVKYYGQGENPYGMNVTRMDSHGGWIATPADLVQFFMHVDGFATPPNILKPPDDSNHDHRFGGERRLCQGLGGQQGQQLVARRQFARHLDHRGAHTQRVLLGGVHEYAAVEFDDGWRPRPAQLEHGAAGQGLAGVIRAR